MHSLLLCVALALGQAETETHGVLSLVPVGEATIVAVNDGPWSSPWTWGGELPEDGDRVLIPAERIVQLDVPWLARLHWLRVDGWLEFAPTEDTRLLVETIIVAPGGVLGIGSEVSPIIASAEVVFIDRGPINTTYDPKQQSRGLISLGMTTIVGAEAPAWDRAEALENDGKTRPAGLERTVTLRSEAADPTRRGHVMLMHHADYEVGYAAFVGLGRTNKAVPISSTNPRGRYPMHFHRCGLETPIEVVGVVVEDSPGWGLTNHSSHVIARDCVTYDVLGSGFVTEAGDERGAFQNCLAVKSAGSGQDRHKRAGIGDFGHSGHGFWLQGPDVAVTDCLATGHRHAAFFVFAKGFKEPDTGKIADPTSMDRPMAPYERNIAKHSKTGHSFEWVSRGSSEYSTMLECLSANCLYGANMREASVNVVGGELVGLGSLKGTGILFVGPYRGKGSVLGATVRNFTTGVEAATMADSEIADCVFSGNGRDVFVSNQLGSTLTMNGNGAAKYRFDNAPLSQSSYEAFWRKRNQVWIDGKRAYYDSQRRDFIRYPSDGPYAGMTNQQVFDAYGWLPMGAFVGEGASDKGSYWLAP